MDRGALTGIFIGLSVVIGIAMLALWTKLAPLYLVMLAVALVATLALIGWLRAKV